MEVILPISQAPPEHKAEQPALGPGPWDRKRARGVYSALDFWGRHERDLNNHPVSKRSIFPLAVQRGLGDMYLNDWFAPDELIGLDGEHLVSTGDGKQIFEAKINVSDYKPAELKVKMKDGLVTIEGNHHETKDRCMLATLDTHSRHFKRSFTVPHNVLTNRLECNLTEDGKQLIVTAPAKLTASPERSSSRRSSRLQGRSRSNQEGKQARERKLNSQITPILI